jgi:hypothetical protein
MNSSVASRNEPTLGRITLKVVENVGKPELRQVEIGGAYYWWRVVRMSVRLAEVVCPLLKL